MAFLARMIYMLSIFRGTKVKRKYSVCVPDGEREGEMEER